MKFIIKDKKGDIEGTIPDTWDQLTVKQFTTLEAGLNEAETLAAMSGIELEIIENTDINLQPVTAKLAKLFNEKPPEFSQAPKTLIIIDGKEITFPKTLDFTRFGQKSMVKNLLNTDKKIEEIVSDVFAIYAQPIIDGKFLSNRVEQISKTIDELPIIKVFPYVLFFFKRSSELRTSLKAKLMGA